MNKLTLLLICLIWSASINSQTYFPLIGEDKTWNVLSIGLIPPWPPDSVFSTVTYKTWGDTVVNSQTYKKVYSSWEEFPVTWDLWCLMREDEDKKVWMRYKSTGDEFLAYDFSVEAGDSAYIGEFPEYLYVDSITMVMINDTEREKYWLSCKIFPDYYETWIEGIGSDKGIVWSGSVFLIGGYFRLLCMSEGDELIFVNPEYNSCYIITGIGQDLIENILFYPNPAGDHLIIEGLENIEPSSITLMDLSGRKVMEFAPERTELDISGLNKGTYILRISMENKVIAKKIIIE